MILFPQLGRPKDFSGRVGLYFILNRIS